MTYCVGLRLDSGIVFMADTRTNSGVDNISTVKKIHTWCSPGDRVITLMTAGNLATTQTLVSLLDERSMLPSKRDPSILTEPTMFQVARLVGSTLREIIEGQRESCSQAAAASFNATLILGGQISSMDHRLFLIYPEGNFIEATVDSPFFQIGETKYGRPILLRGFERDMSVADALKLLMVSFNSTIKTNLSVGLPLDLHVYSRDSLERGIERRFPRNDPYYTAISQTWGSALKNALHSLPDLDFATVPPDA